MPEPLKQMQRTANLITNPLFRFVEREVITGYKLLEQVRSDLRNVKEMCAGTIKSTNDLKQIATAINID